MTRGGVSLMTYDDNRLYASLCFVSEFSGDLLCTPNLTWSSSFIIICRSYYLNCISVTYQFHMINQIWISNLLPLTWSSFLHFPLTTTSGAFRHCLKCSKALKSFFQCSRKNLNELRPNYISDTSICTTSGTIIRPLTVPKEALLRARPDHGVDWLCLQWKEQRMN